MSTQIEVGSQDEGGGMDVVQALRDARDATSVHKLSLANLRAYSPCCVVFVCEGVDDKRVYFHWLKYLQFNKNYEFLVCNGKDKVLKFRDSLSRDLSGLKGNVYFIVDKDFDGLRGYQSGDDIYMTETYSFENFLVNEEVLGRLLSIEMHCHSAPQTRIQIIEKFHEVYELFLEATRPHNFRIYLARRLGIEIRNLPKKVAKLAVITLVNVSHSGVDVNEVIALSREPAAEEVGEHEENFNSIEPKFGFRGKFAVLFFFKWIELLAKDRNSEKSVLFESAPKVNANAIGQLTIDSLAAKSSVPESFREFVVRINKNYMTPSIEAKAS